MALVAIGDTASGQRLAEEAAAVHEELVAGDRGNAEFRWRLARCLDEVGRIRSRSDRPADGAGPLARSAALYESVARDDPVQYRLDLARNQLNIAYCSAMMGRRDQALTSLRRAEDLLTRANVVWPVLFFDLACAHSLCSAAGCRTGDAQSGLELHADRAFDALRRATAAGFKDLDAIRRDRALDSLRTRRDFKDLLMDLSFPDDAYAR
jgi:tetratricopeptide (TPR) repeat protein